MTDPHSRLITSPGIAALTSVNAVHDFRRTLQLLSLSAKGTVTVGSGNTEKANRSAKASKETNCSSLSSAPDLHNVSDKKVVKGFTASALITSAERCSRNKRRCFKTDGHGYAQSAVLLVQSLTTARLKMHTEPAELSHT